MTFVTQHIGHSLVRPSLLALLALATLAAAPAGHAAPRRQFSLLGIGIDAIIPNDDTGSKTPNIKISGASLVGNSIGILVEAPILKLRNSVVTQNQTGIEIRGTVGVTNRPTWILAPHEDLGNNYFAGDTVTASVLSPKSRQGNYRRACRGEYLEWEHTRRERPRLVYDAPHDPSWRPAR